MGGAIGVWRTALVPLTEGRVFVGVGPRCCGASVAAAAVRRQVAVE